jgi:hypothetical protein
MIGETAVNAEIVNGYQIARSLTFDNGAGVAFGVDPQAAFPLATWLFNVEDGKRNYYDGHFFILTNADLARLSFSDRVAQYKTDNPTVKEKTNYLASVEMSAEGNYNKIDGIINNTPKQPPSVIRQLEAFERKSDYHIGKQNERREGHIERQNDRRQDTAHETR